MPTAQVTDDETMPLLEIPQSGYKCGTMSLEAPGAHSTLGAQENVRISFKIRRKKINFSKKNSLCT